MSLTRGRFTAVIEQANGRRVVGFMSGNQQDSEIVCGVFSSPRQTSSMTTRSLRHADSHSD